MIACVHIICVSQKHLTLIDAKRNKLRTKVCSCVMHLKMQYFLQQYKTHSTVFASEKLALQNKIIMLSYPTRHHTSTRDICEQNNHERL